MKRIVSYLFVVLLFASSNSQAQSEQQMIEQMKNSFRYVIVRDNAFDSCWNEYELPENISDSENDKITEKIRSICWPKSVNAAIAVTGMTEDQIVTVQQGLGKKLCLIYQKTKSTKIRLFFKSHRLEIHPRARVPACDSLIGELIDEWHMEK